MSPESKLWDQVNVILQQRGQDALQLAKCTILQEKIEFKPLRDALQYFVTEFWFDYLHPTLISLACEVVGGKHSQSVKAGAAIVLLAGAADVHDDIIDQSTMKETKPTVFGKFGRDITLLAGDALLLKGLYLLHESCEHLPTNKKQEVLESIKQNFFEISSGVAKETCLRSKTEVSKEEFLEIVRQKVSTAESAMKIGAILGNGTEKEIAAMSHYGRTLGMLLSLRDEFIDIFEADELKNRFQHESLPLPILLALQNKSKKQTLFQLLQAKITEESIEKILELSVDSKESRELVVQMKGWVEKETENVAFVKNQKDTLTLLLECTLEDL